MYSATAFFRSKYIRKGDTLTVTGFVYTFKKGKLRKIAEDMRKFYAKHNIDVRYRGYLDGLLITVMI